MSKAKDLLDLQNLKKNDRYQSDRENLRKTQKANQQWRWVGFDATTGQGIVSNGSDQRRGKVITNGAIVTGQLVDYNEVNGFGTIKSTPRSRPAEKPKPKKFVKKKKAGERIALYYKPSQRTQHEIGAIGPSPIPFDPLGISYLTKTADGWIADESGFAVSRSYTGDSESVTDTLANGHVSNTLDQGYAAAGYKPALSLSSNGHFPVGYGFRSLFGVVLPRIVTSIPPSVFAYGIPSDSDNNVTRNISWLEGFVNYGVPAVTLVSGSATRQPVTASIHSINGSINGLTTLPDGATKTLSWSQNARFYSGGTYPTGETFPQTVNSERSRLIIASSENSNFIFVRLQQGFTSTSNATGSITTETTSIHNRIIWRRNGAEVELASYIANSTSENGVITSQTINSSTFYSLLDDNFLRFNLVDDKLYRVVLDTSDPIAGTYTVETYQLPAMTMTSETVTANPIADYSPDLITLYPRIASYHPG